METDSKILPEAQETIRRMHFSLGTFVQIEASGQKRGQVIDVIEEAFSEIKRVERVLSRYLKISQVFKINQCGRLFPLKVSPEIFQLLEEAIRISHLTRGAFDVTVAPIMELWDLAGVRGYPPAGEEFEKTCSSVGYDNIILNRRDRTIFFKKPGIKIDLGGIGKGYAVDRAIDVLKKNGIKKALVDTGGNIFCLDEDYSPIGIKNPLKTDDIIATVPLKDRAISTSANYERFFSIGGKDYGHLVNPKTGYSVNNGVLSVSIISPSAKTADALSTAVFIMGQDKGMRLIENTDNLEGVIVTKRGGRPKIHISSGLRGVSSLNYLPS